MGKRIDLTGQRFGRLLVVEESDTKKDGRIHWICKCDCGNTKVVSGKSLRRNLTRSCGCILSENLIGKRFGRLIVLDESKERRTSNGSKKWLCRCDCGVSKTIAGDFLKDGKTKSCGCYQKELSKPILSNGSNADMVEKTRTSLLKSKTRFDNTSGVKGVSFSKRDKKWHSYLTIKGSRVFSKKFLNLQDAINARKEAEQEYFKPILEKYGKE